MLGANFMNLPGYRMVRPPAMGYQPFTLQPQELMRAALAARGVPGRAMEQPSGGFMGMGLEPPRPAGGARMEFRNVRSRALLGRAAPEPLAPPAFPASLTQAIRSSLSLPSFRPGGNRNPWNVRALQARGIDPFGPVSPYGIRR